MLEDEKKFSQLFSLRNEKLSEIYRKYNINPDDVNYEEIEKNHPDIIEINRRYDRTMEIYTSPDIYISKISTNNNEETSPDYIESINNAIEEYENAKIYYFLTQVSYSYKEKKYNSTKQSTNVTNNKKVDVSFKKDCNQDIIEQDYKKPNYKIHFVIDKNNEFYKKNKDNINEVPIKILDENDNFIGYVHTISWIENRKNLIEDSKLNLTEKSDLIKKTKELRNKFIKDNKIDINKLIESVVIDETGGCLNISNKKLMTINEAFGKDENVLFKKFGLTGIKGANEINGNLFLEDFGSLFDMRFIGSTFALIPAANELYISSLLQQIELDKSNKKNEIIHNILGILLNSVKDKNTSLFKIKKELRKYIYNQTYYTFELKENWEYIKNKKLLFNIDLYEDKKSLIVSLLQNKSKDKYVNYKITNKNGKAIIKKIIQSNNDKKLSSSITYSKFEEILLNSLKNKYINFDENSAINPKKFYRLIADENYKLLKKEENYRDYLSDFKILRTRIYGIKSKDGNKTYLKHPTIDISSTSNICKHLFIPKDIHQKLIILGYSNEDIELMKLEKATDIIDKEIIKKK